VAAVAAPVELAVFALVVVSSSKKSREGDEILRVGCNGEGGSGVVTARVIVPGKGLVCTGGSTRALFARVGVTCTPVSLSKLEIWNGWGWGWAGGTDEDSGGTGRSCRWRGGDG